MADSGGTRKLTVTACEPIHTGAGKNGKPYTIFEVFAVDESGTPVEAKLRSFDPLALNVLVEYDITRREDAKHGTSYTLQKPGKREPPVDPKVLAQRIATVTKKLAELTERLERTEAKMAEVLAALKQGFESGDSRFVEITELVAGSTGGPLGSDEDIPF